MSNNELMIAAVILLAVLAVAKIISDFYQFAQKRDPQLAAKLKDIALVADFITAEEEQFSSQSGSEKFNDGLKILQAIFPQAHLDLLKGALQFSYDQNIKPNKTKQKQSENSNQKEEVAETTKVDQPKPIVTDPKIQGLLDDLEVK
ncbi:MAG: hypothetical protein LKF01_00085 [Lactobacillus sp.]|jgi:hypothetical protein|nr:hypothetical protein [Lactobacillus sp.]MCH3989893.1 hypothetical protein [Lactobacillus sp.]MCH4067941.1 hypothetical protein [Lactobacillus sp.]MCI1303620.1 hypothetical protein [Lactobacillus sp.]MCI1329871.1 hypothetical protein [Lactobacillus sp.]